LRARVTHGLGDSVNPTAMKRSSASELAARIELDGSRKAKATMTEPFRRKDAADKNHRGPETRRDAGRSKRPMMA